MFKKQTGNFLGTCDLMLLLTEEYMNNVCPPLFLLGLHVRFIANSVREGGNNEIPKL